MLGVVLQDGRQIKMVFSHTRYDGDGPGWGPLAVGRDAWARAMTECRLYIGPREKEVMVGEGFAFCSTQDNFAKEPGRRLSLARALESAGLGREDSGALLAAYFGRKRGQNGRGN